MQQTPSVVTLAPMHPLHPMAPKANVALEVWCAAYPQHPGNPYRPPTGTMLEVLKGCDVPHSAPPQCSRAFRSPKSPLHLFQHSEIIQDLSLERLGHATGVHNRPLFWTWASKHCTMARFTGSSPSLSEEAGVSGGTLGGTLGGFFPDSICIAGCQGTCILVISVTI